MSKEITEKLARFVVETDYQEIPKNVLEFTKGLILKTVAGMTAGSGMPSGKKMANIIRERKLPEDVGVVGCGFKTSLWDSIFLSAFFSHAAELEDDYFGEGLFWDITVIPLVFPLAERLRLSGRSLIEAIAVGLEAHARTCSFTSDQLGIGVIPGSVGPAAAAAKAMNLDLERTASALGLAMSGPHISILNYGTDAHYFESALQSLHGIMAAQMAKEGMTSNPDIASYLSNLLGKDNVRKEKISEDLGKKWLFTGIWIKKYPCCFYIQRQIDILLELRKKHKLSYEDVEKIDVYTSPGDEACNRPEPKSLGDLQFSLQHILGAAMLDGDVNYKHIDTAILYDPKYKEARSKVNVIPNPELSHLMMVDPARLTIVMKDGQEFSGERQKVIGSPEEPLSISEIGELYKKYTKGVISERQIERTLELLLKLENLRDIEQLVDLLVFRHKALDTY